jgi:hypothetical protein
MQTPCKYPPMKKILSYLLSRIRKLHIDTHLDSSQPSYLID